MIIDTMLSVIISKKKNIRLEIQKRAAQLYMALKNIFKKSENVSRISQ